MLATDTLIGLGAELAPLAAEALRALDQVLPAHWSHGNPIDIIGDAGPERFEKAVGTISKDPTPTACL